MNTLIPVFCHVLPMRNRRKNKNQLRVKPELLSEVRIRAEPTWYLEDASLFRVRKTGHIFQTDLKRGPYSIYKYIHKLVKNLLCRYTMYAPLSMTQRYTVMLNANEGGGRGRDKNYKEKDQSSFLQKCKRLRSRKAPCERQPCTHTA